MSEKTNIAWCDSTLNFWEGCTKVSTGCANCYAEARDKRFTGGKLWGKGAPRRKSKSAVKDALAFNRKPWICDECGIATDNETLGAHVTDGLVCNGKLHHRRIFSLSLGDWLDDEVPIEWLAEMLDTIRKCPDVDWILCTKRPENFFKRMDEAQGWDFDFGKRESCGFIRDWRQGTTIPPNIILLASVENQAMADLRIPQLLKIPAARRGLSLEPLLGVVNLTIGHDYMKRDTLRGVLKSFNSDGQCKTETGGEKIDWLIIGGESGTSARPCNVEWIRSLVAQGKSAGVPGFVKQFGAVPYTMDASKLPDGRLVGQWNMRDKKGGDITEWPKDLQVQEFYK